MRIPVCTKLNNYEILLEEGSLSRAAALTLYLFRFDTAEYILGIYPVLFCHVFFYVRAVFLHDVGFYIILKLKFQYI